MKQLQISVSVREVTGDGHLGEYVCGAVCVLSHWRAAADFRESLPEKMISLIKEWEEKHDPEA